MAGRLGSCEEISYAFCLGRICIDTSMSDGTLLKF